MNRLRKVFDNLDLEVEAGQELDEYPRRRASSLDCIEGHLKGSSGDDDEDKQGSNNETNHESPRRKVNPRRGVFPKRHSTSDCVADHQNSLASSFGAEIASVSLSLDNPRAIKKLDSQNSFPDFVGALGARHLALQASADVAKDKERRHDELSDSDHIDPEKRLHHSADLRGSFANIQPKEARLRRSKHLSKFKQHRSDDNLDRSDSGYDSSSSFGSVGDLLMKALASAGTDLESETAATNLSNAAISRRTTRAAHLARHQRGSYTEEIVQPKTGFGQNLPCIAPEPQRFGTRGSDYCEEIIYRRRSSASYASRRRSSRSTNNKGDDSNDDEQDTHNNKHLAEQTSHKPSSRRKSRRRASRGNNKTNANFSTTTSYDSFRSSGSCRSEAQLDNCGPPRRISTADQSCDSFRTLASIEAGMKKNRFAPV
eukprot:CAMPEP_0181025586 /NCGR_PEP_ID=MMETSP1070-20121207/3181_1 /TAXON_ID=265543 /ORGANISM="Minutocellus polymorphus, Strain NH13" /LENGTH=427 /DNA_ID=CAMNT_0023102713 /DNA_START=109 /DNA_END=1392 /DNA_ORIENTATION=-